MSLIEKLRALPLHQRHLFMWCGSAFIFLLVAWLWTFQLRHELALLGASTGQPLVSAQNQEGSGNSGTNGVFAQISLIMHSMGKASASLVSFIKDTIQPSTMQNTTAPTQAPSQGDELNQFLPYQPFPEN